jgi:hypothetical protein
VSDHSTADASVLAVAAPEFDKREQDRFGRDDGHAVTAITRMLIIFFFYSLIIMGLVTIWTWLWAR